MVYVKIAKCEFNFRACNFSLWFGDCLLLRHFVLRKVASEKGKQHASDW